MDLLSKYNFLWIIEQKFINCWASQPSLAFNIKSKFFVKSLHGIKGIVLKSTYISIFSFPFFLIFLLCFYLMNADLSLPHVIPTWQPQNYLSIDGQAGLLAHCVLFHLQ